MINVPLVQFFVCRFLIPGRDADKTIPALVLLSVFSIAASVGALIWASSIRNGIESEVVQKLVRTLPEIEILRRSPKSGSSSSSGALEGISKVLDIERIVSVHRGAVAAASDAEVIGAELLLLPSLRVELYDLETSTIALMAENDRMSDLSQVIVGEQFARRLGVGVGERLSIVSAQDSTDPHDATIDSVEVQIVRIVRTGNPLYDRYTILSEVSDPSLLTATHEHYWIAYTKNPPGTTEPVARQLRSELGPEYQVRSWEDAYSAFSQTLRLQRQVMMAIVGIATILAALAISSLMYSASAIKSLYFALLTTLGAVPRDILHIILIFAASVGVLGALAGIVIGVCAALGTEPILSLLSGNVAPATNSVAFLPLNVPAIIRVTDVLAVSACSLAITIIASFLPALRLSLVRPAVLLRGQR